MDESGEWGMRGAGKMSLVVLVVYYGKIHCINRLSTGPFRNHLKYEFFFKSDYQAFLRLVIPKFEFSIW